MTTHHRRALNSTVVVSDVSALWLSALHDAEGKLVGITDCCLASDPCSHHHMSQERCPVTKQHAHGKPVTDGAIIRLARQLDALMWKQRELLERIRESGHPNAEELAEDLDQQCATLAWPTHVTHHHLEHPERFECGDFGIRRQVADRGHQQPRRVRDRAAAREAVVSAMPVTPETLTDEMIDALQGESSLLEDHELLSDCQLAQRKRDRHWTRFMRLRQRNAIKRICDAINARRAP